MNRSLLPLALALALPFTTLAQGLGIGTTTPDPSAALDVSSTTQGVLVPRMTQAQRLAIANPAVGLLVYQTDGTTPGLYVNTSTGMVPTWTTATGDNLGNHTATQDLNLQGNALVGTGSSISSIGVGVRADGGLNLGQNAPGNNVLLGYQAGQALTPGAFSQGSYNLFAGYQAGYSATTGYQNVFSGYQAGYSTTTGYQNLFSGYQAGYSNTQGGYNLFLGYQAGYSNTYGSQNQFSGYSSGYSNTSGTNNIFSGYHSGYSNTTGSNNLFTGYNSGTSSNGSNNIFTGYASGLSNTSGSDNLFVGSGSGSNTTSGNGNVFVGSQSGYANNTGGSNTALGYNSGPASDALTNATAIGANASVSASNALVLGSGANVGIGTSAPDASAALDITSTSQGILVPRLTAAQRTAIAAPATGLLLYQTDAPIGFYVNAGTAAAPTWTLIGTGGGGMGDNLGNHTATQPLNLQANALVGTGADVGSTVGLGVRADGGLNIGQNTAGSNIALGYQAGNNGGGALNTFLGYYCGYNNTGTANIFVGYNTGLFNTSGSYNLFVGNNAGQNNSTGNKSIFLGYGSGYANTTGNNNLFSGYQAGAGNTTGRSNLFMGSRAGYLNATSSHNVFLGDSAGYHAVGGSIFGYPVSDNTFTGYQSGFGTTTGYFNVFNGAYSGHNNTSGSNNVFSGTLSGYATTTGHDNVFSGYDSGYNNVGGVNNLFNGSQSGSSNTNGSANVFSGYASGSANTSGNGNVFEGNQAGASNQTGSYNTALGYSSGPSTTNLTNATAIGANAVVAQSNSLVLGSGANVGIGTSTPGVPLDVQAGTNSTLSNFTYFGNDPNIPNSGNGTTYVPYNYQGGNASRYISIRAVGNIVAPEFDAVSDRRLKTVLGLSNNAADLALLQRLRITDYQMRDQAQFGARRFKKVIAQEVEEVYPQAVSRHTAFLPDIYALATAVQAQPGDSLLLLTLPAALPEAAAAGQRLRLVGAAGPMQVTLARASAAGSTSLVVRGAAALAGSPVFVYGLEHADVRAVDYEALSMLGVSATQALAQQVAELRQQNATLQAHATQTDAALQTLQAQVARLLGTAPVAASR